MTGLIPTYFRRITSSMTAFLSSGSVMALPPYLITKVRPKKVRMYGNASINTWAFSIDPFTGFPPAVPLGSFVAHASRAVTCVDLDVIVGEIAPPPRRLALAFTQIDQDRDFFRRQDALGLLLVKGEAHPVLENLDTAEVDGGLFWVEIGA